MVDMEGELISALEEIDKLRLRKRKHKQLLLQYQGNGKESSCNTPILTPNALNVYDVYIVNNHGAELKPKAPPSICYAMFRIEIVTDGISRHMAYIKLWHHVNMHFN